MALWMCPHQGRYVEEKRAGSGVQQYEWLAAWLYEQESGGQESWYSDNAITYKGL
jgi:hypothetical protein